MQGRADRSVRRAATGRVSRRVRTGGLLWACSVCTRMSRNRGGGQSKTRRHEVQRGALGEETMTSVSAEAKWAGGCEFLVDCRTWPRREYRLSHADRPDWRRAECTGAEQRSRTAPPRALLPAGERWCWTDGRSMLTSRRPAG